MLGLQDPNADPTTLPLGVWAVTNAGSFRTVKLIGGVLKGVMSGGGVGTPQQAHGLDGAELYTQAYIEMLASDPAFWTVKAN